MIRLIGGPARCGKSTLTRKLQKNEGFEGQVVSLDGLREELIPTASAEDRLILKVAPKESEHSPQEWMSILRQRDYLVWKSAKELIDSCVRQDSSILLEGCIWPDYAAELAPELGTRAVFLVDTSPDHADRLIEIARGEGNENNWMKDWPDERLQAWAQYNIARSKEVKDLAQQHGFLVFDIVDLGITAAQDAALQYLIAPE
jgi:2-phosphoglycerate kinase